MGQKRHTSLKDTHRQVLPGHVQVTNILHPPRNRQEHIQHQQGQAIVSIRSQIHAHTPRHQGRGIIQILRIAVTVLRLGVTPHPPDRREAEHEVFLHHRDQLATVAVQAAGLPAGHPVVDDGDDKDILFRYFNT